MIDLDQLAIGARIKALRGNLRQQDFAKLLGVGRTSIVRYEAGERMPDAVFLVRMNAILGVDPVWLLTDERGSSMPAHDAAEQVLLGSYRRCSDEARATLIQTAALLAANVASPQSERGKSATRTVGISQTFNGPVTGQVVGTGQDFTIYTAGQGDDDGKAKSRKPARRRGGT